MPYSFLTDQPSKITNDYWVFAEREIGEYPEHTASGGKWLLFVNIYSIDKIWAKIKIATENNNEIKVRVLFATSLDHGLPNNLSIEFNCTILDISTMAISILVSCCLQLTAGEHNNPDHPVNMFRGPLDSSSLTSRVQDILWCSIDKAQRISANLSTDSGTVWLDLSGELEVGL